MQEYVFSLSGRNDEFLNNLRKVADEGLVPIITPDTERLLSVLCKLNNPKKILEIGTAIGYSAICYAKAAPEAKITSIESRERSYHKATENIKNAGFSDRITVLLGKAEDRLKEIEDIFDIIFIDAAKGQYQVFFDLCEKNMKQGTLIISDNVLYKGMPASDEFIDERRNKTIARRMRSYLDFLSTDQRLETSILSIGDGVALSYFK